MKRASNSQIKSSEELEISAFLKSLLGVKIADDDWKETDRMTQGCYDARSSQGGFLSFRLFILVITIGLLVPISIAFIAKAYKLYGELSPPVIEITEIPRGIGIAPVKLTFTITDSGAGIDEVVVRARQRGRVRELLRRKGGGASSFYDEIPFLGPKSNFQEGAVTIEILAFDRAFWSNRGEKTIQLRVDYHKPKIEVVSTQHNARRGGSQLVFYRVFDEDTALSGIKVGNKVFQGFRASGLDSAFTDPNLYVAFYALDITQAGEDVSVRAFAEDQAGNGSSERFYNKILDRPNREVSITLSEEILRGPVARIFDQYGGRLTQYMSEIEADPFLIDTDPLVKRFKVLNDVLRLADQEALRKELESSPRFESFLKQFFLRQPATRTMLFGDKINYQYESQVVGSSVNIGSEFLLPGGQRDIVAVNDGIVMISENRGFYGRTIVIDHGLGVASVYAHLDRLNVHKGSSVKRGEIIGTIGDTGLTLRTAAYLEMRVHGVPVDPLEWWDPNWFNQHVVAKIDEMKRALGLQVVRPL